jgi:hypothetical protein
VLNVTGGGPVKSVDITQYRLEEARLAAEDAPVEAACDSAACQIFARTFRLAELGRRELWPAITPHWPYGTVILYVIRSSSRRITNNEEFIIRMHNEFSADRGYVLVLAKMEELPVAQQILLASRATVMIGPHGAGLTHSMWMQPGSGSSVLELSGPSNRRKFFGSVTQDHMLDYYVNKEIFDWESDTDNLDYCTGSFGLADGVCSDKTPEWDKYRGQFGNSDNDIEVNIPEVLSMLRAAVYRSDLRFGPPKSCTRPVTAEEARTARRWLYGTS